jgi:hypothetical protein
MRIETKYREGLKLLMKSKPLDEINVVMLCDAVKSNRQTFYYHYRDISDVIESMFLKERIGYGIKPFEFESIVKPFLAYVNSNVTFLTAVANSFASDKVEQFFYSFFYQRTTQYLKLSKKEELVGQTNVTYVVRYISSLFSKETVFWILNKRKERQVHLQKRFSLIWDYFINSYSKGMKGTK